MQPAQAETKGVEVVIEPCWSPSVKQFKNLLAVQCLKQDRADDGDERSNVILQVKP